MSEDTQQVNPTTGEVVDEPGVGLARIEAHELQHGGAHPPGLLAMGLTPEEAIENATRVAMLLTDVLRQRGMLTVTGRDKKTGKVREHVNVEGWTTLCAMTGHSTKVVHTAPCVDDKGATGYEATAVLIDHTGMEVGRADGMCTRSERDWSNRDSFALRGMAQTRAISRAVRSRLDFVVKMAGFQTTPDNEMPVETFDEEQLRAYLADALSPLVEEFGRDAVNDAWKEEGRPWLRVGRDDDVIARIRERCTPAPEEPVAGEPADQAAPESAEPSAPEDVVIDVGADRLQELCEAAMAVGIDDVISRLEGLGFTSPDELADDTRWGIARAAVDGWVAGAKPAAGRGRKRA